MKETTSRTLLKHKNKINTKAMIKLIMEEANRHHNDAMHKDHKDHKVHTDQKENRKIKQYEVRHFLDILATCMSHSLQSEKSVFLPKVGVFEIQDKKATRRRNPQNGEFIKIPERKAVKCRFFKSFSTKALNKDS